MEENFNKKYQLIRDQRTRINARNNPNIFTPQTLTIAMAKTVGGANEEGYFTILDRSFTGVERPAPSSYCRIRRVVSWTFFCDLFTNEIDQWQYKCRPKYRGLYVNAIDGDLLTLPHAQDIFDNKYRGTAVKDNQETYYPTMYYCCAVDLITGVPTGFSESHELDEIARAIAIISAYSAPEMTLSIFDRFYFCKRLLKIYSEKGGYFIARCKTNGTFTEITAFSKSTEREKEITLKGVMCRLIKYQIPNENSEMILITNLKKQFKAKEIGRLYGYRWENETSNKDRTSSIKIEQFHCKNINGVRQEIWMTLTLQAAGQMLCANEVNPEQYFMQEEYRKSNFKAVFYAIVDRIGDIIRGVKDIVESTLWTVKKTIQKRTHYKRKYKRETKQTLGKQFKRNSLVPRRPR